MDTPRPTISSTEAAKILGVTDDTIRAWFDRGLIEGYKTSPLRRGRLRLYRDAVEEFDRQRKSRPSGPEKH